MKRIIGLVVISSLVLSCAGCGKKDNGSTKQPEQTVQTVTAEDTKADDDNKPVEAVAPEQSEESKDTVADLKEKYEAFLNGQEKLYCDKYFENCVSENADFVGYEKNTPYTMEEFVRALLSNMYIDEVGDEYSLDEVQYAYIDCGMDGIPELALRFPDIIYWNAPYEGICVIKEIDGKLQLCYEQTVGYRGQIDINENGMINYDGSGGAALHYYTKKFLDANGDMKLVYNMEEIYGTYDLYVPWENSIYERADELGVSDSIYINGYEFTEPNLYDYEKTLKNRIYTYYYMENYNDFSDDEELYKEGNPYYELMNSTGLNFCSPKDLQNKLDAHEKEVGYTKALESDDFIRWTICYHAKIDNVPVSQEDNYQHVVVSNPGWEYFSKVDYDPYNLPITLTEIKKEPNDIIDDDKWLNEIGKEAYNAGYCSDDYYEYYLSGNTDYEPYIINIYNKFTGEHEAELDMSEFTMPINVDPEWRGFVFEAVRYVQYSDGLFYVAMNHRTYASSAPENGYIIAIDPNDGYSVRWKSQPLVSNALNFQIEDNTIICGYGFTDEPDYIYLLDKHSGVQMDVYKVKTGPDYMFVIDGKLYVRTYDTNYVYQISFG